MRLPRVRNLRHEYFSPAYQSQPKNISYLLINIRPTPLLEQERSRTCSPSRRRRKIWSSSSTAPPTSHIHQVSQRREQLPTIRKRRNADKKYMRCRRTFWASERADCALKSRPLVALCITNHSLYIQYNIFFVEIKLYSS